MLAHITQNSTRVYLTIAHMKCTKKQIENIISATSYHVRHTRTVAQTKDPASIILIASECKFM